MKLGNSTFKDIIDYINKYQNCVQVITDPVLVDSDEQKYTKMYKFEVIDGLKTTILAIYRKEGDKLISIPFDYIIENNNVKLLLNSDKVSKILYIDSLLNNSDNDWKAYTDIAISNLKQEITNELNTIKQKIDSLSGNTKINLTIDRMNANEDKEITVEDEIPSDENKIAFISFSNDTNQIALESGVTLKSINVKEKKFIFTSNKNVEQQIKIIVTFI